MDYSQFRIGIGVPQPDRTDYRFNDSLLNLLLQNAKMLGELQLMGIVSSRVAMNRNKIVEAAQKNDLTHILWIDSDQVFPIHGLIQLLRHDKDIVGATTCKRDGSDELMIADFLEPEKLRMDEPLAKVINIGFPFMLTKMSVFNKMEAPWFAEPPAKMMRALYRDMDLPQANTDLLGEDIYFCAMARHAGFDLWCDVDLSLQIGHIGSNARYVGFDPRPMESAKVDIELENVA